jgi:hypothetical protein
MELLGSIPKPEPVTDVSAPARSFQVLPLSELMRDYIEK